MANLRTTALTSDARLGPRSCASPFVLTACLLCVVTALSPASAVQFDWVHVGDAGNFAGPEVSGRTLGAVDHEYRIGKYEVTNAQYTVFLNAKDPSGSNSLALYSTGMASDASGGITFDPAAASGAKFSVKPGHGNQPVNYVSWFDAVRFVNWVNNGQGDADTEDGAYTLHGGTPTPLDAKAIVRNPGVAVALPSEDEWYKAAYYDPNKPGDSQYWLYPTQSDERPQFIPPSNTPNSANMRDEVTGYAMTPGFGPPLNPAVDYLSDVGAYSASSSYYGTFDQAGNVFEWNDGLLMPGSTNPAGVRGVMGGAFASDYSFSWSQGWAAATASGNSVSYGFRMVSLRAAGDANGDGIVDGADYTSWADQFLTTTTLGDASGDFNGDGFVDGADYTLWADNFAPAGSATAARAAVFATPEPASLGLAISAILLIGVGRIRSRRARS